MRFKEIKPFKIDNLLLDEGNYRFKEAKNQKESIAKIYFSNPPYFKGLMESIALDDLGEPLLVYTDKKKNIVLDGNRRLAALKVLSDDKYLPAENLQSYVNDLRSRNNVDFASIQAQVSSDKKLVMRTVYERHAGGKTGKARIAWNAYAAARFGFFEEIGDNNEWHFVALLTKTEELKPTATDYIDSNKFSYETFRRLMREAFKRSLISQEIFSPRNKRIKSTANKKLVSDAVEKTLTILQAMARREISLSRGENFADQKTVEKFFDSFTLSPDAQRVEDAKNAANQDNDQDSERTNKSSVTGAGGTNAGENKAVDQQKNETSDSASQNDICDEEEDSDSERQPNNGITKSELVENRLKKINSVKLSGLYRSLCRVSLNTNPQLMYVGAWSFLECMCDHMGKNEGTNFKSFLDGRMNAWQWQRKKKKDCEPSLEDIMKKGNANKHSAVYASASAMQLRVDFQVLDELIVKCLDDLIEEKKKKAL